MQARNASKPRKASKSASMSKSEDLTIADLVPDNKNANMGTERGAGALEHSLRHYGAGRSVLVDKNNRIIAGNKTIETAASIGMENAVLVETTGDRVVVVRRTDVDLDSPEGRGLAIADNRAGELNLAWNQEVLAELGAEIDLTPYFFEDELELPHEEGPVEGLTDDDDVPEVGESPVSERGDIWILGNHRVMCGDSTDAGDVALLMDGNKADMVYTDPPYGISIVQGGTVGGEKLAKVGVYAPVAGDCSIDVAISAIKIIQTLDAKTQIIWGGNYYASELPNSPCWIVWDKENTGNFADVELAWTNQKTAARIFKHMWNGMLKASERGEKRVHPTQKPVMLALWCFDNYGQPDTVLDLFLGSGSTLIACEKNSCHCFGMELSPAYVDVIIKRWQDFTGKEAVHENGRTYQEMSDVRS